MLLTVETLRHLILALIPLTGRISDTELDVTSTVRLHPLEFFVNPFIGLPVVLLLGLPAWSLAFYELLDIAVTLFSHSNLRIPAPGTRRLPALELHLLA